MEQTYVESIRKLVEMIREGSIQVPRFQRPFVWSDDQRVELLQSIQEGIPVGSILLWRTSTRDLACFDRLGPHPMRPPPRIPGGVRQYLLDGHQRLSTLFGALHFDPEEAHRLDPERSWEILYDLREEAFFLPSPRQRERLRPEWLPSRLLTDPPALRAFQRGLERKAGSAADGWNAAADRLLTSFQEYRIPVALLVTEDLDKAIRSFQRINRQGTPLDEVNMVAALTWSESFDLRERLETLREQLPDGWREIEFRPLLQVIKGVLGLEVAKVGEERLVERIKARPDALGRAQIGLTRAAHFFSELGVHGAGVLPYQMQGVLAAIALSSGPGSPNGFASWFWRTSWLESFASASSSRVQRHLSYLEELYAGNPHARFPDSVDPEGSLVGDRFDWRSARTRALVLLFAAYREDGTHRGVRWLSAAGAQALARLFPYDPAEPLTNSAANRVLLPQEEANALVAAPETQSDEELATLMFSLPAIQALRRHDRHGCLAARQAYLEECARAVLELFTSDLVS